MQLKRLLTGISLLITTLPSLAHADLVFIGRQSETGQGFGNVLNILTMQNTPMEAGAVAWNMTQQNVIFGTTTTGCPANTLCLGPDTGTSNNPGMTSTQTIGAIGWTSAQDLAITLNLNQTGANPAITLESLAMNVYSPAGVLLFSAALPAPHVFTAIEQGTGSGFFVFQLTAAQQAAAQAAVFAGGTFANDHVGLSALLDNTANDGPETFGATTAGPVVPEPTFYGALAIGLSGLVLAARRSRRRA
jgi:hypothetical protein